MGDIYKFQAQGSIIFRYIADLSILNVGIIENTKLLVFFSKIYILINYIFWEYLNNKILKNLTFIIENFQKKIFIK